MHTDAGREQHQSLAGSGGAKKSRRHAAGRACLLSGLLLGLLPAVLSLLPMPAVAAGATAASGAAARRKQAAPAADPNVVRVQLEHTWFHPLDNVVLQVERMEGRMVATPGHTISLDDPLSFTVQVDRGVTRLSATSLSSLINDYLLRQSDSPIRHVDVSFAGQQVMLKGEVHKLLTLPFVGRATLLATPTGDLRLHMEDFRVAGVVTKDFFALFGLHLDKLAQPRGRAGYRIQGDDILTSLSALFPPPTVYGRVTRLKVEGQDLVQVIGIDAEHHAVQTMPKVLQEPANYLYFTGGRMRFGKVTMDNVDLKLVNLTPHEAFDFSLVHYQEQIQAGYVKVLPTLGLVVYAENYSDLRRHGKPH